MFMVAMGIYDYGEVSGALMTSVVFPYHRGSLGSTEASEKVGVGTLINVSMCPRVDALPSLSPLLPFILPSICLFPSSSTFLVINMAHTIKQSKMTAEIQRLGNPLLPTSYVPSPTLSWLLSFCIFIIYSLQYFSKGTA